MYISALGENDTFERKGSKLLDLTLPGVRESNVLNELAKQLSAFSNIGGGRIFYGVADDGTVDNGGVALSVKGSTKEWIGDVVPTLTEFQIVGFNVYEIRPNPTNSKIATGQFSPLPYEAGSYPLSGMATVSIHREQVMVSGVQPTANHRRQLPEGLFVSSQNPQSNPTRLLSETINSKLQLTIDERRHPLMSRGLPALVFGWQLSRYVGTHSALWRPQ